MKSTIPGRLKDQLIVSCQAREDAASAQPVYYARMALAASPGGGAAIRAHSRVDIQAIQHSVMLIIAIIKRD